MRIGADDDTEVTTNENNHGSKRVIKPVMVAFIKLAPRKNQVEDATKDLAKAAAQTVLKIAAKAFCRVAILALVAYLQALEDLIPNFGEILNVAEIAAAPAIIQACVKGIAKEFLAEFIIFRKNHSLSNQRVI